MQYLILKTEAAHSIETLISRNKTTWRHYPEYYIHDTRLWTWQAVVNTAMNLWVLRRCRKLPFLAGWLTEPNIPVATIGPLTAWYSDPTAFLASAVADLKGVFYAVPVTITVCVEPTSLHLGWRPKLTLHQFDTYHRYLGGTSQLRDITARSTDAKPSIAWRKWQTQLLSPDRPSPLTLSTECMPYLSDLFWNAKCKAKPVHPLRVPGGWGSQISWLSMLEGGKVVSPTHRPSLPQEIFLVLISVRG